MRFLIGLILLFSGLNSPGQNLGTLAHEATYFQLPGKEDTIEFLVFDTVLTEKKPLFLFCQGSLPIPLGIILEGSGIYLFGGGANGFDLPEIRKNYHLLVISMPKTPMIVGEDHLSSSYCYLPDKQKPDIFSPAYVEANYLVNYVQRAQKVLKYLRRQPWVDPSRLVVAGHSQGAKVATKVALENKHVTHLGLFGANPMGRADQAIRQLRADAREGRISWEEANLRMEQEYAYFRAAHHPDSVALHPEMRSWKSFSEPFYDDWLQLEIPVYLAYGTEDPVAELCYLVPLFFIQEGKSNLSLKRYARMDHNFFEIMPDGNPDYEKAHWAEVMNTFVEWTLGNGR
ncbi:MAG: alpha/beta fold hydrolase [Bacteroidia bacterium]|nr:alpha/beta fold hydrolase [Bacteroidia bacterium]